VNLRRYRLSAICQPRGILALGRTPKSSKIGLKLVGATGFEPATPCAQGRCATRLRYAPTSNALEFTVSAAAFPIVACLGAVFLRPCPKHCKGRLGC
jgi:hypothetical protein